MYHTESSDAQRYFKVVRQEPRPDWDGDRENGWKHYFLSQAICEVDDNVAVLAKSGENTPTGAMVMHFGGASSAADLPLPEVRKMFGVVRQMVKAEIETYSPQMQVELVQWAFSGNDVPFQSPRELGPFPKGRSMRTAQTIKPWHIHADLWTYKGEPVQSPDGILENLRKAYGPGKEAVAEQTARTVAREIYPSLGVKMAARIWNKEIAPWLTEKYPGIFRFNEQQGIQLHPVELVQGWDTFGDPKFAEAIVELQQRIIREWETWISLVNRAKDSAEGVKQLTAAVAAKPWMKEFSKGLLRYAKIIRPREEVNQKDFLNQDPNFMALVTQERGGGVMMGIYANPIAKAGDRSAGYIYVRDPNQPAGPEEVRMRREFRAMLAKKLVERIPGAKIGQEGQKSIQEAPNF